MATLTFRQIGPWSVLSLMGEIQTFADAATLRAVLFDRLTRDELRLAIDIRELAYIGSGGIGVIAQVQQELEKRGKTLVLIGASTSVRHLLEIVSLDRVVLFVDRVEDLEAVSV